MSTSRAFAYNTGSTISGTIQVGDLSVGTPSSGFASTGLPWWEGPDEDLGYVIAVPQSGNTQPTPVIGVDASVGFYRTKTFTDNEFIQLSEFVSNKFNNPQVFSAATQAKTWLVNNGFWTSYQDRNILSWDIQNILSYPSTGNTITDLQGNSNGSLVGTINYVNGTPKYLEVQGGPSEYLTTITNLNPFLSPPNTGTAISLFLWVYPTGNGCIINEQGASGDPNSAGWHDSQIEIVSGALKFRVWPLSPPYLTSSINPTLNTWNYIGFTYSGNTLTGYLNGQSVGSVSVNRQTPYNQGSTGLFYSFGIKDNTNLGSNSASTFRFGAFDVYNVGLNSSEVLDNFNSTKTSYGL